MRKVLAVIVVMGVAFMSGCAGRAPQPVAMMQVNDSQASCLAIQSEIYLNSSKISNLNGEEGRRVQQNMNFAIAGVLFFPPLLLAMDLGSAATQEIQALESRNVYLSQLLIQRCADQSVSNR